MRRASPPSCARVTASRASRKHADACLGPLDEDERVLEVRLEVGPLRRRDRGEAVEVEVGDGDVAALVAVTDGEGGAGDRRGDAERTTGAADEGRLAGAELAGHGDDVSDLETDGELCG